MALTRVRAAVIIGLISNNKIQYKTHQKVCKCHGWGAVVNTQYNCVQLLIQLFSNLIASVILSHRITVTVPATASVVKPINV